MMVLMVSNLNRPPIHLAARVKDLKPIISINLPSYSVYLIMNNNKSYNRYSARAADLNDQSRTQDI